MEPGEADDVVAWICANPAEAGRLGVVTPFSAQAALIRDRLRAALGAHGLERREITIGTAHRFQGDQCDVVLFATTLAAGVDPRTASWVETQRNLVNVAVSRAGRGLVVFADTAAIATLPVPILRDLVEAAGGRAPDLPDLSRLDESPQLHSEAERRLFTALSNAGHIPRLKPIVEGFELDFALTTVTGHLDIEVDGIHHTDVRGRQRRQDLARDHILHGLGWRVVRVPAWRCLADPAGAAEIVLTTAG